MSVFRLIYPKNRRPFSLTKLKVRYRTNKVPNQKKNKKGKKSLTLKVP